MEKFKKYWKQIAIGLSVVFLAIAGYLVYTFEFKDYDTADEEVDKITKDEIEVDLPDDTTITVDEDGEVTTEEKEKDKEEDEEKDEKTTENTSTDTGSTGSTNGGGASTVTAANNSTSSSATPAKASASNGSSNGSSNNNTSYNNNNASNGSGRVTVSQIKNRYDTALVGLEDTANDRLNSLVSRAKTEYQNDDNVSYARYYNKYTSAAEELENRADAAFYAIVAVMERDLEANGLAASHTKSVINEYENKKKQRKNALLKKAAGLK